MNNTTIMPDEREVVDLRRAARVDGRLFATELAQALRVAGTDAVAAHCYGVRLWLEQGAILVQGRDHFRLTAARIPADVEPEAIGRTVMLPRPALTGLAKPLAHGQVELGLSADPVTPQVSLSGEKVRLVTTAVDTVAADPSLVLYREAAVSVTVDRALLRRMVDDAARRAGWNRQDQLFLVVHLSGDAIRVTHGTEDDPDDGAVVVLDVRYLTDALLTLKEHRRITISVKRLGWPNAVTFTAADAELGDLATRHHFVGQGHDPRPSRGD